jgi:hypothetical protein
MLPISERNLGAGAVVRSPTLAVLNNLPDLSACKSLDHFALFVLVASILGRIVRYNLQQRTTKGYPPWDFRSDFAKISTMLLSFENILSIGEEDLAAFVLDKYATLEGFDRPRVGHFIWSRGLYHLSCCLLHHPFFLYRHLRHHRDSFPPSFARASLRHCQEHAEKLTTILKVVHDFDCCARGSFLGYFAVVAGSVHRLYEHSTDLNERARSKGLSQVCLDFLQGASSSWDNYPRMVSIFAFPHPAVLHGFQIKGANTRWGKGNSVSRVSAGSIRSSSLDRNLFHAGCR